MKNFGRGNRSKVLSVREEDSITEKKMEMLKECSSMTNVTIVCSDGIIHTHKIVVASASDFIKHLLSDIPVSDEITLYLPDHEKTSVMKLLDGVFSSLHKERSCLDNFLECENVFHLKGLM